MPFCLYSELKKLKDLTQKEFIEIFLLKNQTIFIDIN